MKTFVDRHDAQQRDHIAQLLGQTTSQPERLLQLRTALAACHADELLHRDEAIARQGAAPLSAGLRLWLWAVARGSAAAVALARRF